MSVVMELDKKGRIYLEFDDQDLITLKNNIKMTFGNIRIIEKGEILDRVEFGGEEFIYYYEWDPCLLPTTDKGSAMLQQLANNLRDT